MATTPEKKRAPARKIDTPTAREKLPRRRPPYWHKLTPGHFVGYRITPTGERGYWLAKVERKGVCEVEPMGPLEYVAEAERFTVAKKLAEEWFKKFDEEGRASAIQANHVTLRQALVEYTDACRTERPEDTPDPVKWATRKANFALWFFNGLVLPFKDDKGEEWKDMPLSKLRPGHFQQWRAWLADLPQSNKHGAKGKRRTGGTINRYATTLRAALNRARDKHRGEAGEVVIPDTWNNTLLRVAAADVAREEYAYIEREDREALFKAAAEVAPDVVPFMQALLIAPIRPGAVAHMQVCDYDARRHAVKVRFDKVNSGRWVLLPQDAACKELFRDATRDKADDAPLFANEDGLAWTTKAWGEAFRASAEAAGLSSKLSMYCLRHTRITDLIDKKGVSVSTVAKMAGTSAGQIEKHYHKVTDKVAREALAGY